MRTRNKDYSKATRPPITGTPGTAAPGDQEKTANSFQPPPTPISTAKHPLSFATWNIRTLLQPEAEVVLSEDLSAQKIDIACIQETRITRDTTKTLHNSCDEAEYRLYCSGHKENKGLIGHII